MVYGSRCCGDPNWIPGTVPLLHEHEYRTSVWDEPPWHARVIAIGKMTVTGVMDRRSVWLGRRQTEVICYYHFSKLLHVINLYLYVFMYKVSNTVSSTRPY
jgi:hypothetical protein